MLAARCSMLPALANYHHIKSPHKKPFHSHTRLITSTHSHFPNLPMPQPPICIAPIPWQYIQSNLEVRPRRIKKKERDEGILDIIRKILTPPAGIQRPHVENIHALHLPQNLETLETSSLLKVGGDCSGGCPRTDKICLRLDLCKST